MGALEALLAVTDPAALSASAPSPGAACPGEGPIKEGSRVVPTRGGCGLVRGKVYFVASVREVLCTLRSSDDKLVKDPEDQPLWIPASELAAAGAPLDATPVALALISGCSLGVVSALVARAPEALSKLDALGRTPLAVAAEVQSHASFFNKIF